MCVFLWAGGVETDVRCVGRSSRRECTRRGLRAEIWRTLAATRALSPTGAPHEAVRGPVGKRVLVIPGLACHCCLRGGGLPCLLAVHATPLRRTYLGIWPPFRSSSTHRLWLHCLLRYRAPQISENTQKEICIFGHIKVFLGIQVPFYVLSKYRLRNADSLSIHL